MSTTKGPQPFTKLHEHINQYWVLQDREFGIPTKTNLAVTGQSYITLYAETLRVDRGQAFIAGENAFMAYAKNRPGILYWRFPPTIERVENEDGDCYQVEMQLLISDNPVVSRLMAEALRDTDTLTI